jgi:hypothetical protein
MFYGIFAYMLREIETYMNIKDMEKYGGNRRKLVVIFNFWSRFWVNRDFGFVTNCPPICAPTPHVYTLNYFLFWKLHQIYPRAFEGYFQSRFKLFMFMNFQQGPSSS